jgi:hypothetical protein
MRQSHLTEEEITLLLMGEAGWWKTRQAKKHILQCENCQAHCEAFANVWQTVQTHAEKPITLIPTRPLVSRRWVLAGLCVATIGGIALLARPGMMGGPNISFAEVEKAMSEVKTVGWTEIIDMRNGKTSKRKFWTALNPEKMYVLDTRSSTVQIDGYYHQVTTHNKHRTFQVYKGYYSEIDIENRSKNPTFRETIKGLISAPLPRSASTLIQGKFVFSAWKKTAEKVEGKETFRFDQDIESPSIRLRKGSKAIPWLEHITIWVDSKTHRVIRRENTHPYFNSRRTLQDFHYNETLPKEISIVPTPNIGETYSFRGDASAVTTDEQKQMKEALNNYHPKIWFASWRVVSVEAGRTYTEGEFTHTEKTPYPPTEHTRWSMYAMVEITTKGGKKNTDKAHFVFVKENGKMRVIQDSIKYLWPPRRKKN